jgi:hypothetical protein
MCFGIFMAGQTVETKGVKRILVPLGDTLVTPLNRAESTI